MTQQRHLIGRTILEISTGQVADVSSWQEEVSRLFQQQAVPEIERLFDRLVAVDQVIRLDQVVVEMGPVDREDFAAAFLPQLLAALHQTLSDQIQDAVWQQQSEPRAEDGAGITTRDRLGADGEVLLHFLQFGRLPWWVSETDWRAWLPRWDTVIQGNPDWQRPLRPLLGTNPAVRQRLVEQFPEAFRLQLLLQLQPAWTSWPTLLEQAQSLIQGLNLNPNLVQDLQRQAWHLLLAAVPPDPAPMQPLPVATWTRDWLTLLGSVALPPASPTFAQYLRDQLADTPGDVQQVWQAAIADLFPPASPASPAPPTDTALLLDFLQQGRLPAAQAAIPWPEWLARWVTALQNDSNGQSALRGMLATHPTVRQRLVEQFPEAFRLELIQQLQPAWTSWPTLLEQAQSLMQDLPLNPSLVQDLQRQAWHLIPAAVPPDPAPMQPLPVASWIRQWLTQLVQRLPAEIFPAGPGSPPEAGTVAPPPFVQRLAQHLQDRLAAAPLEEQQVWQAAIADLLPSTSPELPGPLTDAAVLLDFLQQGRLPAAQATIPWPEWLARWLTALKSDPNCREALRGILATHPTVRQRLVEQFPEAFHLELIGQLQPAWTPWPTLLEQARFLMQGLELSPSLVEELERQAWEILLAAITPDNPPLGPLPIATWIDRWLTQLIHRWLGEATPDVPVPRLWPEAPSGDQRLQRLLDTLPEPERGDWQAAIAQVWADRAIAAVIVPENEPTAPLALDQPLLLPQTSDGPETEVQEPESLAQASPAQADADWAILLDFLQQGQLPAGQAVILWSEWLSRWTTVIQGESDWREPLRRLLATQPRVRQRLGAQFPLAFRQQLILQMQPLWIAWPEWLQQAQQVMQVLNLTPAAVQDLEVQAWELMLAEVGTAGAGLPISTWVQQWLTQLVRRVLLEPESNAAMEAATRLQTILESAPLTEREIWLTALEQVRQSLRAVEQLPAGTGGSPTVANQETGRLPQAEDPETGASDSEPIAVRPGPPPPRRLGRSPLSPDEEIAGLYVTQAGLVLLHPFLRFYLEAVELVVGETFRDETAQQTAIYLMHYLATKQTDAPEYELVLPKLLCGWPLDQPVVRGLVFPEAALTEGETLLQTVIDYWEVLKSTTPDGLREGFLQRQGKLTRSGEENWKLQVEQQAIDILLSRLPWGVSLVKLPWMDDLLVVEWH